jgi:hypothetical protein
MLLCWVLRVEKRGVAARCSVCHLMPEVNIRMFKRYFNIGIYMCIYMRVGTYI